MTDKELKKQEIKEEKLKDVNGGSSLSDINPNDIENIEILKDASSPAIYGSRSTSANNDPLYIVDGVVGCGKPNNRSN